MRSQQVQADCPECGAKLNDLSGLHGHLQLQHSDLDSEELKARYEEAKSRYESHREAARRGNSSANGEEGDKGMEETGPQVDALRARLDELEQAVKDLQSQNWEGAGQTEGGDPSDDRTPVGRAVDRLGRERSRLRTLQGVGVSKHEHGEDLLHVQHLRVNRAESVLRDVLSEAVGGRTGNILSGYDEAEYRDDGGEPVGRDGVGVEDPFAVEEGTSG